MFWKKSMLGSLTILFVLVVGVSGFFLNSGILKEMFIYSAGGFITGVVVLYALKLIFFKIKEIDNKYVWNLIKRVRWKFYLFFILAFLSVFFDKYGFVIFSNASVIISIIIGAYFFVVGFEEILYGYFLTLAKRTETKLDDILLPIVKNVLIVFVVFVAGTMVFSRLGLDPSILITSFGVGGLAVAFASKEILQNFFGSIVILLDKAYVVGDRIKVKGIEGKVIDMTLRSTKIRLDDGTIATIPNALILKDVVINVSEKDRE